MPEFEESNPTPSSSSETYSPRTDASQKPRTRRRSGGFKKELTPIDVKPMGEVSAAEAVKQEKLSGRAKSADSVSTEPRRPRRERTESERPSREPRAPRESPEDRAARLGGDDSTTAPSEELRQRRPKKARVEDKEPRGNAQPSAETLAVIAKVEARIQARREERRKTEGRSGPRKTNRSEEKNGSSEPKASAPSSKRAEVKDEGLIASITGFFSRLLGSDKPAKNSADVRAPKAGADRAKRPDSAGRSGDRPNRGPRSGGGGRGRSGGGGQGRRSSGGGNRRSSRASSES